MKKVLYVNELALAERNSGLDIRFWRLNKAVALSVALLPRARAHNSECAVFCGGGEKGEIGFWAASWLKKRGVNVTVYAVEHTFSAKLLGYAKNLGLKVCDCTEYKGANIIVDAICGPDEALPLSDGVCELLNKLNAQSGFKIAADLPTGINADTGEAGTAFRADVTVAFSSYKYGHLFGVGPDHCGKVCVEDIGLSVESGVSVFEDGDFKPVVRKKTSHKGSVGRIYVIGGCGTMVGAPLLAASAAHAAFLNGAGTVVICVPSVLRAAVLSRAGLAVTRFMRDTADGYAVFDKDFLDGVIKDARSIVIGMGMGGTPDLKRIVEYLCANYSGALVLDADALNALNGDMSAIAGGKARAIITPHVGEFKRLTGKTATAENARELAKSCNCIVVLKSSATVITDGESIRVNTTGTPAMAKGGTGDVLAGCIAALTCSFEPFDAATVAAYRNGIGAERAVRSYAELMLTPAQMLKYADYSEIFEDE